MSSSNLSYPCTVRFLRDTLVQRLTHKRKVHTLALAQELCKSPSEKCCARLWRNMFALLLHPYTGCMLSIPAQAHVLHNFIAGESVMFKVMYNSSAAYMLFVTGMY